MNVSPVPQPAHCVEKSRFASLLGALLIVAAALIAYHNSFNGPLVFDDTTAIETNPSIRDLSNVKALLTPPPDLTVTGRPVANVTLAINYAIGGTAVRGYHVMNLLIHALAGLALFGVVRRTLLQPGWRNAFGEVALPLAVIAAMLWVVHPLQTESVTYVIQRVESLMGLWYLLTLYCFLRSVEAAKPGLWRGLAFVACLLGMATKEVMASAPLVVLLYDRTFVAGSFRQAWRERRGFYLSLASTWILLAWLIVSADNRNGSAGFGTAVSPWHYLLTQCKALVHYLWLVVWPNPLVFDHGEALVRSPGAVLPQGIFLITLALGTIWALVRRPALGFVGFCFFALMAPSSSIVPVATQTMAEHRIYLALAVLLAGAVIALFSKLGRRSFVVCAALALVWTALTIRRNEDYRDEVRLWQVTAQHKPENPRAFFSLGHALSEIGDQEGALAQYKEALAVRPDYRHALCNAGNALLVMERNAEAAEYLQRAVDLQPDYVEAQSNLGAALFALGRQEEALKHCEIAVGYDPKFAGARNNLGLVLVGLGRSAEAIPHYEEALRLQPGYAEVSNNLGNAVLQLRGVKAAIPHYEAAVRMKPDYADGFENLASALTTDGRLPEALAAYQEAARLAPSSASAQFGLGNTLLKLGRMAEAVGPCVEAVRLRPDHAEAHSNLGTAFFFAGKPAEALEAFREALRINPAYVKVHYFMGNVLMAQGKTAEARAAYEEAIRLNPGYQPARQQLAKLDAAGPAREAGPAAP